MGRFEELGEALDLLFGKILNRNFNKADELIQKTEQELSAHKSSTQAHDATAIKYDGKVVGAGNTKQAIDNVQEQVNTLVLNGDSSVAAKQAAIDVNGHDYQNLKLRLDTEYEQVTSQLADKAQTRSYSTLASRKKGKRPIVTIVSDDGTTSDYSKLLPLVLSKNVPFGLGIITNRVGTAGYMPWAQIREMEAAGCEIMSHSHMHANLTTLTPSQIEEDVSTSLKILRQQGFNPQSFVYPFNAHNNTTTSIVRRYFDFAFSKPTGTGTGKNYPTIDNQIIRRIALGSYFDSTGLPGYDDTTSLEYYKARVDEAVANTNWLVFVIHPAATDAVQMQHLSDTIDYIHSIGVDIVSPSEGFDIFGNIIDVRGSKTFIVSADGDFETTTDMRVRFDTLNQRSYGTSTTEFSQGKITYTPISNNFAVANDFPEKMGGILITYRITSDYYQARQEYIPTTGTGALYFRYANSSNTWGDWESSRKDYVVESSLNKYSAATLPSGFPFNRVTTFVVNSNGATGMPNNAAGIVTVYSVGDQYGYRKQEFRPYNSVGLWMRTGNNDNTWGAWTNLIPG